MPFDNAAVLRQIDDVLARYKEAKGKLEWDGYAARDSGVPDEEAVEVSTLITHTLERFRPAGRAAFSDEILGKDFGAGDHIVRMKMLAGLLSALRADYAANRLQSFRELVHADLFADFLEMAGHLLDEGYKDPAAVMIGGVLEEHLRKLCGRHSVPATFTDAAGNVRPKRLDTMNADLAKAGTYNKIEQQSVTAWAAVRNAAAHGEYGKYDQAQVRQMLGGVRDFIARHPA